MLRKIPGRSVERLGIPSRPLKHGDKFRQNPARLGRQQLRRLLVQRQRPARRKVVDAVREFDDRLRALLQAGHRSHDLRARFAVDILSPRFDEFDRLIRQHLVRCRAHVVAVQIVELLEVDARRAAPNVVEVEPLDGLLRRNDLVVAVAPTETQ